MSRPGRPEVLAPAGDPESLAVALEAGADAVYFGLGEGLNARARATNFSLAALPEVVARIHRAGARAYLTLNTLVFQPELALAEAIIRQVVQAGVDALIVQDPGLALLARAVCPELELHASTQMTISSPEAADFATGLGVSRVVLPRELSLDEIGRFAAETQVELEVFIAGALCVSWSGQCLSSEAWGGRSANRGQCAQACRLPYDLMVDGRHWPLGDVTYLLSPRDLAGFRAVPGLVELGVHTLKVEGRQKGPVYVRTAVAGVRRWVEAVVAGTPDQNRLAEDVRNLALAYSRGLSDGFLAGSDHQSLVEGISPRHRGVCLGEVTQILQGSVLVRPRLDPDQAEGSVCCPLPELGGSTRAASGPGAAALVPRAGMGVLFDQGDPQHCEQGGPIFSVQRQGDGWRLGFGRPGPDLSRVRPGARVLVTSDPELTGQVSRAVAAGDPLGRIALRLKLRGTLGEPLEVVAQAGSHQVTAHSRQPLAEARRGGLDAALAEQKLAALGGTPFRLKGLDASGLAPGLFLPVSELKRLRRELVAELTALVEAGPRRRMVAEPQLPGLLPEVVSSPAPTLLVPLCREPGQLEAVIEAGLPEVELDWMEFVGLGQAVGRAREAGLRVTLATVRVQKPGEEVYDRRIQALEPDGVLVRHWAGVMHFSRSRNRPTVHGDFSLNVTNGLTAHHLLGLGLDTLTAAHDLDADQLLALLEVVPAERMAVTVHHHIPTFHTEHCVYSSLLSNGRDYRTCGRPCEKRRVSLRDRTGQEHPVVVDVECRNTVFNAAAQSAAFLVPELVRRGVARVRVEFVRESHQQASAVLAAYSELLAGRLSPAEASRHAGAHEQFGVTRGTMQVAR